MTHDGLEPTGTRWVVRQYDGFDNQWLDVCGPTTALDAFWCWLEKTRGGTQFIAYSDIDYYAMFPATTHMLYSGGFGER